jgi:hypothetical protein
MDHAEKEIVTVLLRQFARPASTFQNITSQDVRLIHPQSFREGYAFVNGDDVRACGFILPGLLPDDKDHTMSYLDPDQVTCLVGHNYGMHNGKIVTVHSVPVFAPLPLWKRFLPLMAVASGAAAATVPQSNLPTDWTPPSLSSTTTHDAFNDVNAHLQDYAPTTWQMKDAPEMAKRFVVQGLQGLTETAGRSNLENIPKIQDSITKIVAAVKADVAQLDTRDITQLAHLHGVLKTQYERLSDAWVAFKGESYVNAANKYETAQKVAATKEYLIQTEATIMESFNTIIEAQASQRVSKLKDESETGQTTLERYRKQWKLLPSFVRDLNTSYNEYTEAIAAYNEAYRVFKSSKSRDVAIINRLKADLHDADTLVFNKANKFQEDSQATMVASERAWNAGIALVTLLGLVGAGGLVSKRRKNALETKHRSRLNEAAKKMQELETDVTSAKTAQARLEAAGSIVKDRRMEDGSRQKKSVEQSLVEERRIEDDNSKHQELMGLSKDELTRRLQDLRDVQQARVLQLKEEGKTDKEAIKDVRTETKILADPIHKAIKTKTKTPKKILSSNTDTDASSSSDLASTASTTSTKGYVRRAKKRWAKHKSESDLSSTISSPPVGKGMPPGGKGSETPGGKGTKPLPPPPPPSGKGTAKGEKNGKVDFNIKEKSTFDLACMLDRAKEMKPEIRSIQDVKTQVNTTIQMMEAHIEMMENDKGKKTSYIGGIGDTQLQYIKTYLAGIKEKLKITDDIPALLVRVREELDKNVRCAIEFTIFPMLMVLYRRSCISSNSFLKKGTAGPKWLSSALALASSMIGPNGNFNPATPRNPEFYLPENQLAKAFNFKNEAIEPFYSENMRSACSEVLQKAVNRCGASNMMFAKFILETLESEATKNIENPVNFPVLDKIIEALQVNEMYLVKERLQGGGDPALSPDCQTYLSRLKPGTDNEMMLYNRPLSTPEKTIEALTSVLVKSLRNTCKGFVTTILSYRQKGTEQIKASDLTSTKKWYEFKKTLDPDVLTVFALLGKSPTEIKKNSVITKNMQPIEIILKKRPFPRPTPTPGQLFLWAVPLISKKCEDYLSTPGTCGQNWHCQVCMLNSKWAKSIQQILSGTEKPSSEIVTFKQFHATCTFWISLTENVLKAEPPRNYPKNSFKGKKVTSIPLMDLNPFKKPDVHKLTLRHWMGSHSEATDIQNQEFLQVLRTGAVAAKRLDEDVFKYVTTPSAIEGYNWDDTNNSSFSMYKRAPLYMELLEGLKYLTTWIETLENIFYSHR